MTDATNTTTTKPSPRRRRARGCLLIVLALFVIAAVLGVVVYRKWHGTPQYRAQWSQRMARTTVQEREASAVQLEQRITLYLSARNPDQPNGAFDGLGERTFRMNADEINDWLELRSGLKPHPTDPAQMGWLQQQGIAPPAGISDPAVSIVSGHPVISFQMRSGEFAQVFSVFGHVAVPEDGKITLRMLGVRGGNLPLPARTLADLLKSRLGGSSAQMTELVRVLQEGKTFDASWSLPGDRIARLRDMQFDRDGVAITIHIAPASE